MELISADAFCQPPGRAGDMGQENSKSPNKPKETSSTYPEGRDLASNSSSDSSFSRDKDYAPAAYKVSLQPHKDEVAASSLDLRLNESPSRPSISPESANALPSESLLTDESDIDDQIVANNRYILQISSSGILPQLSTSARLRRGSISEISSEGSFQSSDESCLVDVPVKNSPSPVSQGFISDAKESEQEIGDALSPVGLTSENLESLPVAPVKPPIQSFYIPRENVIPATKDASVKSVAFERLKNRTGKSKIFSNVLTDATERRVKAVERSWKSVFDLSHIPDWQKLLSFGEPVIMNFKLIELKRSFKKIAREMSDFALCSIMFEVLGEITRSKFEAHKAELFRELATPQFINNLSNVIDGCRKTRPKKDPLARFIENFVDVYEDIFLQIDSLASDGLAADLEELIQNFCSLVQDDDGSTEQLGQLLTIIESRDTLIRANSSYPFNVLKEESVESNIIDGPYDNVDHYLTVHYRLMKEDFQNSLRAGVIDHIKATHGLKSKTINYHLNIFKNVTLACHLTSYAVKYKIMFYDRNVLAKLRDPASPHFLTGSLLMLTNNCFQDYYLVRVEDKSPLEREQNFIFVSMVLGPPGLTQMIHFDVMAEPSRLFEPYYRVLNVIRSIEGHHLPFKRYLVDVETDVFPPTFMKLDTKLNIDGHVCSLWENDTWPAPENIGLNPVQLDGLKQALRNELAIIQGPPGTGKTYLSKKIIEVLLQNKRLWHQNDDDGAGLIMVVCFKNQSLDQLLTGLIKDKVKVLRIGTQSREEMLDAYNLKTLEDPKYSELYKKMRWLLANEQKEVIYDLKYSLEMMDEIAAHSGIIKREYFSHLLHLNEDNLRYLEENFERWLLQIPCDEPDFRLVERILEEQTWTGIRHVEELSDVYQITLQDVEMILERINAKLDVLKELGCSDIVDLLTSAAEYLVHKLTFMDDRLRELKRSMSEVERLELFIIKKEFEGAVEQFPLEELPLDQRWLLYKAWMYDLYEHHSKLVESMVARSQANRQRHIEIEELLNMRKIAQCDAEVVGLTTTAAAKYFKMMDCLKPKIVLVEEAAEIMEAHTVASLSKYCKHLILVGDHRQLRPLTSSHIIGNVAHLDYSLYERLVKNGFTPCTLNTQYRMRPDIADLIRPAVYEELFDDPSVDRYPQVLGIDANLYFVDHTISENVTPDIVSRWNKHEAEFHLALCNYLVLQGYAPSKITILATYSEQEKYFNKEKLNYPHLEEVLMATVDSFQGKENDIILLSLVRSNAEAVIGFLAQENRINVALSRAKVGLFITGNKDNLLARDGLWTRVVQVLQKKKAIGRKLPLKCQIHGKVSHVATSVDIKALKNGGCAKQCKAPLPCGHKCIHLCHPLDREHSVTYKCITPCKKLMECSHHCTLTCHATNPRVFKCFCKICSPRSRCEAPLACGHKCQSFAHDEDIEHLSTYQCREICNFVAPCGHICASLCHLEDKQHQAAYKCILTCEGLLACGHPCNFMKSKKKKRKTHGCKAHKPCSGICGTKLPCGHACLLPCHAPSLEHKKCCGTQPKPLSSLSLSLELENSLGSGFSESLPMKDSRNSHKSEATIGGSETSLGLMKEFDAGQEGHSCRKNNTGKCQCQCDYLFACNHICLLRCHKETSVHRFSDRCHTCIDNDQIREQLCARGIDQAKGKPYVFCRHYKKNFNCEEACSGRLCGHRCGGTLMKSHSCLDHVPRGNSKCPKRCDVGLTCGHKCSKGCHLGDDVHTCEKCKMKKKKLAKLRKKTVKSATLSEAEPQAERERNREPKV